MKLRNLMGAVLALAGLAFGGVAHADPATGDIYSIDLVENYGGTIPTKESPLRIGQKAVIRVRLLNREFGQANTTWRLALKNDALAGLEDTALAYLSPDLGIMLGGQKAYAKFIEMKDDVTNPANTYTDMYFEYEVKSGDLAIPAQLMNSAEQPAGSEISLDYYLMNTLYWKITNNAGDEARFHFRPKGEMPEPTDPPGEEQNFCVSGIGMGLFIKTIDFDRNYAKEAETPAEEDIWRIFYAGETETTTIPPSLATEGGGMAERDSLMYVWSDDETVVAPRKIDGAEEVTDVIGGTTVKRWVLPVTVAKSKSTVPFTLKAAADAVGKTAHIRMSSSRNLVVDDFGVPVTNWVERTVQVTDPPEPYISISFVDPAGNPISAVTATADYKQYAAAMIVKLNGKAPTRKTTVGIKAYDTAYDPAKPNEHVVTDMVIPATSADRRIGISTSADPVDQPWGDRVLSVEFNAGETEKTLYVYALDQTLDIDTKINFVPNEDAAKLAALLSGTPFTSEYPGSAKTGSLAVTGIVPTLVKPTAADDITDAMAGESYPIDVTVSDSYRDVHFRTNEWQFCYKTSAVGDTKWHTLKGSNADFTVDGETGDFTVNITFTTPGVGREMEVYVIDPNGKQSNHAKFYVTVAEAKKAWAELDRPDGEYGESLDVTAKAKFFISQPAEDSKALYAFLKPLNEDASNCVSCAAMTTATPSQGVLIAPGDTDSKTRFADIQLLDGKYPKTAAIFEVVICKTLAYSTELTGYSAGQVYLNITNVCPRIEGASIGGIDVTQSGTKVDAPIAQNVLKNFRVSIGNTEPSRVDLDGIEKDGADNRYYTQWKFGNDEWGDGSADGAGKALYGNPNTNVLSRMFVSPGDQTIKVRVQDKDMRARGIWSEEFSFTVTVLDVPSIVITPRYGTSYTEKDTGDNLSHFDVELTAAPTFASSEDRLVVELTVEPRDKSGSYTADGCILSTTNLEFRSGTGTKGSGKSFYLSELDGTSGSAAKGFRITAKVTAESQAKDTEGKTWDPGEVEINVVNVNPKILTPAELFGADGKPLAQVTTVNTKISLAWALDDVTADTNAMSVTWTTSEGQTKKYIQGTGTSTDTVIYTNDVMTGTHTFDFNSSGEKSVTIMVQDKDGGVDSRTLYYSIAASKSLEIVPQGPSTGNGTALSSRYHDKASGLGAGWVDADNIIKFNPQSWVFSGNCGLDTSWRLYASGYTNGQVDVRSALGFSYTYLPDDGKDSFLYAWLQIVQEKDAAKPSDAYLAVSPEHRKAGGATPATLINLPTEEAKDGGYAKTIAEAIFAKEYLLSDNMGDINQDGIPDIYVKKYEFGVIDADGNVAVDDLKAITVANETGNLDEDFLPASGTSLYGSSIPGLPESWVTLGKPFDARTEIRGYHDGLNDAPAQAGIGDVAPDRIYAVDGEWSEDGCTISRVEYLAWREFAAKTWPDDPGAWTNAAYWTKWSPERPTDPCSPDTDDDGFTDGYEYYFWYRAHVGFEENGVHRYLTGRAYDPRNPGEGKFISAAEIEALMDPLVAYAGEDAETRDTDNDGLPDKLEFEIGTNPFDFDTDGDGLPDGFEIMLGGTDPLIAETTKGVSDAMRNFDGDAMAFTTPYLEQNGIVKPKPLVTGMLYTFALVDADGDTDGVQWYVGKTAPNVEDLQPLETCVTGTSFTVGGKTYVTPGKVPVVDGRLAADLDKAVVWETVTRASLTNSIPSLTNLTWVAEGEPDPESGEPTLTTNATDFVALMPTRIAAGTEVTGVKTATYATLQFAEDVTGVNAAWVYGRSVTAITTGDSLANIGGFGMLAMGRYKDAPKGVRIAALPAEDDGVAYLHHFVYQEFGFDPRTAWNANTPLAPRWGSTFTTDGETETVSGSSGSGHGYAGIAARTREYTLYDEFLVMSFFLNNGKLTKADVTATQVFPWEKIWSKYTTNGQGPNEPNWEADNDHYKGRTAETNSGENGADTDLDGVPDGWELYVMAGPKVYDKEKKEFKYNLVAPYNDGVFSAFGPFVGDAGSKSATDNADAGDTDGLTELQEYAGTDSCAYYCEPWNGNAAAFSATIVRPAEHAKWLNKFFPTDPWSKDTDGDGLTDNEFAGQGDFKCARFMYGTPVDDGKMTAIPGGGLNPCTVDTDHDGLPDGWEAQFAGQTIYAGDDRQVMTGKNGEEGNPLQGLCDGMDGTVWDAYNSPRINNDGEDYTVSYTVNGASAAQVVDRDYDKDGLENWQEYLTGAMRCWRYDDPITVWDYVPDAAFFNPMTGAFDLAAAMRHTGIKNQNEFWYRLLFDTTSKWYNPHFVTASTPSSQYFSRVTNGWDQVFAESGTYYMFYNRRNGDQLESTWGEDYYMVKMAPRKYISTSPIAADTDQDGMDDYYELFHGLNPLLGAAAVLKDSNGPCDIVYDAWYVKGAGSPVDALNNLWLEKIPGNGKYDFIAHPWLNGLVDADPDGDDIRNQDEAIMPLVAPHSVWLHTDPTPLWMTDSSYGDSIVSRFFRLPSARGMVPVPDSIVFGGKEYSLVDCDGYMVLPLIGPVIAPFLPDYWQVTGEGAANWAYSFEENEGFDTDHDSSSDFEEKQGKFRSATDPQDADSPRRRQAMYFPGEKAALQSMPFVKEAYPRAAMGYPDDMSFLQYTVECWVRPEAADPTKVYTVLERTSFTDPSHVADERYVRRNFAIQIKNGKWSTAFDTNGTLDDSLVEVIGKTDAKVGEWTHVAATYDANRLTLYVNGGEDGYVLSSLKPEYGSSAVVTYPAGSGSVNTNDLVVDGSLEALQGTAHAYWFDTEYTQHAFLIGASFAEAPDGDHLDVTQQMGWGRYKDFFKGYVDEVRVWDGARSSGDIAADMKKRYTRDDALANRDDFYDQWSQDKMRYNKDGSGKDMDVIPELRFHWAFDSIPGADDAASVAQAPHGFLEGDKPIYSRPRNYQIPWWSGIVGAYGSVYEGERNWVPWIPNTVSHLPRFDLTTLDSSYWSEDYAGDVAGTYKFARTAEPVSKWTQYVRNQTERPLQFRTTGRRFWLTHNTGSNGVVTLDRQFEFTSRHLNQTGDDLLPLGGAFAKYVDVMWDEQGASSMWEQTGLDDDGDGLPNWWQEYVNQNCREGVPEGTYITWDTPIWYEIGGKKVQITAGEAYQRDLAKGAYVDAKGEVHRESEAYRQTADFDADGMPDWWEEMNGLHNDTGNLGSGHADGDIDNDGLSNYQEYLASVVYGFYSLDPLSAYSGVMGQKVTDYFLPITNDFPLTVGGRTFEESRNFFRGEYLGAILSDHDFMEDWWENKYAKAYTSAKVYDPWDDTDGDGWSNFCECRAFMWGGAFTADLIDRYLDGNDDNHVKCYPQPAIGVKVTYANDQINDIAGKGLVVRTMTTGKRVDATFAVAGPASGTIKDSRIIGGYYEETMLRGFLNPGCIVPVSVTVRKGKLTSEDNLIWNYNWYAENYDMDIGYHMPPPYGMGTFEEYRQQLRRYPHIELEEGQVSWEAVGLVFSEDADGSRGKIIAGSTRVGTIDFHTGEYELDMATLKIAEDDIENCLFRFDYQYRIGENWPQTLWLSEATTGRVKEGLNTIEAFIDLNGNGVYDAGEPYGAVKNVQVGWHKVPEVTIELTDESKVVPRMAITAANDGAKATGEEQATADKGGATTATKVRIVRESINNQTDFGGLKLKNRTVMAKEFVMDDRAYLTEADVLSAKRPDLDWQYLQKDAVKYGITSVDYATYRIESYSVLPDGSVSNTVIGTFTRAFEANRPKASVVSPKDSAPVYTSAPTFRFTADEDATAFEVQVAAEDGTPVYDSGVKMLGGRSAVSVGNSAYAFTAPIYADTSVLTNGAPVLVDGRTYKWRVAVFNAKFNTADAAAFSDWAPFQMDVGNANRYPVQPTGYGRAGAVVRYFGPAKTNDLTNLIVVEAFANADFTGQAMAQTRVASLDDLSSPTAAIDTFDCVNALLTGVDAGVVYLRAYIDLNNNGRWDRFEPWGYANMAGKYGADYTYPPIYNPKGIEVGASAANIEKPNFAAIFIEDTDWNKNEIPDCLELALFPESTEEEEGDAYDWWSWAEADAEEPGYAVDGDVMAYAEIKGVRVVVGFEGDDENVVDYLLVKGEKVPTRGDNAVDYKLMSIYKYGDAIDGLQIYGRGTNVTLRTPNLKVKLVEPVTVALVHSQVYDEFGYDMRTANPVAYAAGTAVNTKPFTALDKKLLTRYFEAIGYTPATGSDKYLDEYLDELALTKPSEATAWWNAYSLKVGDPDQNRDGVADGWNLYVMFGPDGTVAACTPWTSAAAARTTTPGGEGLWWVQEYDNGRYPTDPWNPATIGDRYMINGVEYVISDKDAYAYHLKHFDGEEGDKYADFDNDGLANYAEYDIQKNNNRTLDADKMFSYFGTVTIPSLTGQCVPDYFLKSTKRNPKITDAAVYDYLGFDYTSHDFIESWWKDQYTALQPNSQEKYVDRTWFEAYDDPDGDGWDNWSEARAKTDPTKVSQSSIDDYTINEFPVPVVELSLTKDDSTGASNSAIIVQARLSSGTGGQPDATWTVGGRAAGAQEKFLGFNPAIAKSYNLGGAIVPGSFKLGFKDLTADHETYSTNETERAEQIRRHRPVQTLKANADENVWANAVVDTKVDNDSSEGYLVDRNDGDTIYGTINYDTGDVTILFDRILENEGDGAWHTWITDTECISTYYWKSYVRATWTTKATSLSASSFQSIILSDAEAGRLREGPNTFAAFADANGNGEYDPGEAFGCAKDVQVGWDKVVDLNINLTKTSPVIPRFNPMNIGEGGGTNDAVTIEYKGKPVVSDLADYQTVRIVRWEINGEECTHRTVFRKTAEQLGVITEADILSDYAFDLDWAYLERDAAKAGIGLEDVRTVTYAIIVDVGELSPVSEDSVTGWIIKDFSAIRGKATPVAPSKGETAIVTATRPTFEFKAPSGYPAFAFELCDKDDNVVFSSTNHIGAKNAAGNVTYRPPVYFGWDEEADTTNRLLPNGEYTWRVALLSAKYRTAPRGEGAAGTVWSDAAKFTVELAKGKVEDTDKGALDVVVRYYGDAPVDAEHPIIVQAFRTADFTGIPEGQTAITNADLLSSYDDITTVNAKIYGLAAGDYYICAFIDTTNDVKRMRWESWGYVNKVLSEAAREGTSSTVDLYTPVPTKVLRNDTTAAVLFIEDMDCNNDRIPDWMDPTDIPWVWPWPEPPPYVEPDLPVTPEDPEKPDPYDPGGPIPQWFPDVETDENDVMAYEDLEHVLLVKVGLSDADGAARWYAVMDLANEGWKLRDSDIALQTPADEIGSLVSTWEMGRFTGIGTNVTARSGTKVLDTKFATVRLVHAQVYAKNGYETGCAAVCYDNVDPRLVDGIAAAEHPHTKPFTRADKYYFCRYLENIGVEGVSEAKMVSEVEKALKGVDPADYETVARPIWSKYTLDPNEIDMDRDDIADSWEAYVMFGTVWAGREGAPRTVDIVPAAPRRAALADLKVSPFNTADGMLVAPGAGSQLKLVEEFDGGYYPTDPWSSDTDRDGVIDYYAYQYHLKGNDAGKDFDLDEKGEWTGDGLSNYAEYLISEVFRYAKLDPEKKMTDGACVDYFRKMGDLYVGEIFTDHDQVDDTWEGEYAGFANRDLYDPERDEDKDGWSNYAEFRAGTDPTTGERSGIVDNTGAEYSRAEFPLPIIEAKVVYNGKGEKPKNVVFKAWNEKDAFDMTCIPDAVWTRTTDATAEAADHEKYVGLKPTGVQRYLLDGGSVIGSSVKIEVLNKNYFDASVADTNKLETGKVVRKVGNPDQAKWYVAAKDDGQGNIVTISTTDQRTIGTIDAATGLVTIDFSKLTGTTFGDRNENRGFATPTTPTEGNAGYDEFTFEGSHVKIEWKARETKLSLDGTYYLAEADGEKATSTEDKDKEDAEEGESKGNGRVKEGLNTFICYAADASGKYVPGAPFGVVRGVDVGWQGAAFTVELTDVNPLFARVNLYDGDSTDRLTYWGAEGGDVKGETLTNFWKDADWTAQPNDYDYVRVVPYAVAGTRNDSGYYDAEREYVQLLSYVTNRVVAEFAISRDTKPILTEADFLRDGQFDIDWDGFSSEIDAKLSSSIGSVTAVKYRLVFGKTGPVGYESNLATNGVSGVRAFSTLVERRFENVRSNPDCEGIIGGGDLAPAGVVHTAHPTFVWSMPREDKWASRFGSSYTAFKISVSRVLPNGKLDEVYKSPLTRTPAQDAKGRFVWTAPISVGDQTPQGKIFENNATYKWQVSMYNAKFKADSWSKPGTFSTSVNTQQSQNDAGFSSIGVTVKYTGPEKTLYDRDAKTWICEDLTKTVCKVRVQAFETADFSGVPAAETFVADRTALTDATDVLTNACLKGLAAGTYYIRAYIDSNGNFEKDEFESWGYAKEPVTVGSDVIRLPAVGLYIEDADTNGNWYPDAWEYQYLNRGKKSWNEIKGSTAASPRPDGKIVLSKTIYDGMVNGVAGISTGLSGSKITIFQDSNYAELLLDPYVDEFDEIETTFDVIRKAVEKKVVDKTLKITAITLDTAKSQVILTMDAETDYANLVAGNFASRLYDLDAMGIKSTVTVQVWKKSTLAQENWELVGEFEKTFDKGEAEVEVPVKDNGDKIDPTSGFYMIKVVQ